VSAGITNVFVNFRDSHGAFTYHDNNDTGVSIPCGTASTGQTFDLRPDTYHVFVQALGTGNALYKSNLGNPPQITVQAGQFVPAASGAVIAVTMQ
jgi:hypothetical protein